MKERLNNKVLPVNKSMGVSTYDCIRLFKKVACIRKVGHAGTLDPQATGLILLLTGEATKLSNYLMDLPKRYVADVKLGESTDTQDADGRVLKKGDWTSISNDDVRTVIEGFIGKRMQIPPMYSALKHRGIPLYTLARRGRKVDREPREVEAYEIKLVECNLPVFRIDVFCSRGLYLRVLAEEIGESLGVPAHLSSLIRTNIGHFDLESATPDTALRSLCDLDSPGYSLSEAMRHLPAVHLSGRQARELKYGVAPGMDYPLPRPGSLVRLVRPDGGLGAIGEVGVASSLKIRRVFQDLGAA